MDTLGIVDSRSIALGAALADSMVKAASVQLLRAAVVCAGRFLIIVEGDRAAVETAVRAAEAMSSSLAGSFIIPRVSEQVRAALRREPVRQSGRALAVIECRNAADSVLAADKAVKKADVFLMRLVLGQGIGGKSYFVLTGDVAAVTEATDAAAAFLEKRLMEKIILPQPDPAVAKAITGFIGNEA